jgi:hypothetical protein
MRSSALVLALVGLAGAGRLAVAQAVSGGVRGGVTIPAGAYGTTASDLGTGWNAGAVARVQFKESHFGAQFDVGYSRNPIDGPPFGSVNDWQAGLGLFWAVLPVAARVRPYALLGVGVDYWEDTNGNGLTPAVYGSVGFDVRMDPVMPYAEVQYRNVFTPGSNLRTVQIMFGARYLFGHR